MNAQNQNRPPQQMRRGGPMGFGGGGHGGMMKGEKPRDFKGTMARLIKYLSVFKISFLIVVLFAIGSTIFSILGPKILGQATTILFTGVMGLIAGSTQGIDFVSIGNIILLLAGMYLISAAFGYGQGWIMSGVSMKINLPVPQRHRLENQPHAVEIFRRHQPREVAVEDHQRRGHGQPDLNQSLTQIITSVVTVVGVLIVMFSINWAMTIIALLIVPISLAFTGIVISKSQKYFKQQQDYLGHVNGHVEEMYGGTWW